MAGFTDYLDQFVPTNTSEAILPVAAPVTADPAAAAAIAQASNDPMSALTTNMAMDRGNSLATDNPIINDFQTLSFWDFQNKYGADIAQQMGEISQANQNLHRLETATRDGLQRTGDFASGVAKGLVGGIADAGTLAAGAINQDAGIWASETTTAFRDWMDENTQSVQNNQARLLSGIRAELDGQDNTRQYEIDRQTQSGFEAGLSYLGRGFVNGAARFIEDPQSLETGLSEGVGSLLAGGPIARGIGLVGKLAGVGRIATTTAMPAAIGMMEGGSAYSGAVQEVMGMTPEELLATSPTFRNLVAGGMSVDEAREQVASQAGQIAAAIQAPVGALTGTLVSRFEANPLGSKGFRDMVQNILRETTEEGFQSASGQTAQNIGIQQTADINQNILENVGDQTAQGAILGSLTAGVVQAPSVPRVALRTAVDALRGRAEQIAAANEAGSGVTEADIAAAATTAVENVAPIAEAAQQAAQSVPDEIKTEIGANNISERINNALTITENDIRSVGTATLQHLKDSGVEVPRDRLNFLTQIARTVINENAAQEARLSGAMFMLDEIEKQNQLFGEEIEEIKSSITNQDSDEYRALSNYQQVLQQIQSHPTMQSALAYARTQKVEVSETENSPQTVENAVRATSAAPSSLGSQGARTILKQADEGKVTVTPEQRKALRNTQITLEIAEKAEATLKKLDAKLDPLTDAVKDVQEQVMRRGRDNGWALSYDQHVGRVNAAVKAGDMDAAGAALRNMGNFARSQMNKANAWVRSAREGGEQKYTPVGPYGRNLTPASVQFHANAPRSAATARQITIEANMLIDQFNALADANPEIGITRRLPRVDEIEQFFGPREATETAQQGEPEVEGTEVAPVAETPSEAAPVADESEVARRTRELVDDARAQEEDGEIEITDNMGDIADYLKENGVKFREVGAKLYIDLASYDRAMAAAPVEELDEQLVEEPEAEAAVAEPVVEAAEDTAPKSVILQKFPFLAMATKIGARVVAAYNRFDRTFSAEKRMGRMLERGEPLNEFIEALYSSESAIDFIGENPDFSVDREQIGALQQYLQKGMDFLDNTQKDTFPYALRRFAGETFSEKTGETIGQRIRNGEDVAGMQRGHIIAILEKTATQYRFNPALLQSAVLAGLNWFAQSQNRQAYHDKESIAKLVGVDMAQITQAKVDEFNAGVGLTQAARGMAEAITQFWGLDTRPDAPENMAQGIPEAVAKELLQMMEARGWMTSTQITIPGRNETYTQYLFEKTPDNADIYRMLAEMGPAKKLIEIAAVPKAERNGPSYGSPIEDVAPTQMRNRAVRNSRAQRAVIRKAQAIPHYFYRNSYDMQRAIGLDAWTELMGSTVIGENTPFNEEHKKSIKGKNLTISMAFDAMEAQVADLEAYARKHQINDIEQVKKFYQFNYSRVNRLQMLGVNNPQSDKIARHVFLPTKATIDMRDDTSPAALGFWMAAAQGLGVKTQHFTPEENAAQGRAFLESETYGPLIRELQDWLKSDNRGPLKTWAERLRQVDSGITEHGVMSLLSLAEYANARDAGALAEFTTHNYFEADGVTNGAANALMNLSTEVSPSWIDTIARAGAFIGHSDRAMDFQRGKADLYEEAANHLAQLQRMFEIGMDDEVRAVYDSMFRIMRGLGMKISFDGNNIVIKRNELKNPLTITIYGSGVDGIAGNVASEIMDKMYEALSEHMQSGKKTAFGEDMTIEGKPYSAKQFWADFDYILNNRVVREEGSLKVIRPQFAKSTPGIPSNAQLAKIAISANDFRTLRDNVRALYVDNMDRAINDTVMGHVGGMVQNIQKATNAQSIVLSFMFRKEVLKAMHERQTNPEKYNYRRGDFLSRTELDAILKRLMPYGAVINTETQSFFLGSGERSDLMPSTEVVVDGKKVTLNMPETFSKTLDDQLKTAPWAYAPSAAGVAGVPSFNIGTGDGRMIDVFLERLKGFGVLPVFDGINIPVDKVFEGSQLANAAVMQSWTENPAKYVAESFKSFLALNPLEQMFDPTDPFNVEMDKLAKELTKNATGTRNPANIMDPESLVMDMEMTFQSLDEGQQKIANRVAAMKQIDMSVDQMAGGRSPYTQKGTVRLPANPTSTQIATALEHQMKVVTAARTNGEAISGPSREFVAAFRRVAGTDPDTGALLADVPALDAIRKTLNNKLPNALREMLNASLTSLADSGVQVVFGTPEMVDRYEQNNFPNDYQGNGDSYYGKIDVNNNMIYLTNPSAETLAHELLHAATIFKMQGFYSDPSSVSVADGEAITRLEGLMNEWLTRSYEREGPASHEAHRMAMSAIMGHYNAGRKAEALNEFLAWSLTNQNIISLQKKMQVQNPLYRIMGEALSALKRLIWGHKKAPAVGTDMFSNVRFNARVLMSTPTPVELFMMDFGQVAMYQSAEFGTDARLSQVRQQFGQHLVSYVRTAQTNDAVQNAAGYMNRRTEALDALLRSADIANKMAVPFKLNMQQMSTFKMIGATLATAEHLNAASLSRLNEVYGAVLDKLSPSDFLLGSGDPQVDEYQAQEKYKALTGVGTTAFDKKGRSNQLANFVALANVDPQLRAILSKMSLPAKIMDKAWKPDALFDRATNAVASGLANYASGQGRQNQDLLAAMDALTHSLTQNVGDQRHFIEHRIDNGLDNADKIVKTYIERGAKAAERWAQTLQNPVGKKLAKYLTITSRMLTEEGTKSLNRASISFHNQPEIKNAQRELINEIVGRTDENAPVFDMVTRVKTYVDQTRQRWRTEYPAELRKRFSKKLDKKVWSDLTYVVGKTDAAGLFATYRRERTLELLSLGSERRAEIRALEQKMSPTILNKAKQLADYMVTGDPGLMLQPNAHAIAVLNRAPDLETDIDNLVSLYAIERVPEAARETLEDLIENEAEGFAQVFHSMVATRNDEMAKATTGVARMNMRKGRFEGIQQEGVHLIIDSRTNHAKYMSMGYVDLGDYNGSSADIGTDQKAYYFAPVSGRPKFNQGNMQTVQQSVFGVNPDTGYSVGALTAGRVTDPRAVDAITRRIQNQRATTEHLVPVYGENGRVVAYERHADPMKLSNLNTENDLALILGAWRGRQSEELAAQMVNQELVDKVFNIWEEGRRQGRANEYEDMSRSSDPIIRDAWAVIPRETKQYIEQKFGRDGFPVQRGMLLDVAGARSASIGDLWTGNSRWSPEVQKGLRDIIIGFGGNKAYRYLVNAESLLQQVVTDAKVMIVVKSIIVPAANLVANVYQLSMNGVPMRHILSGFKRKTYELNTYIKNRELERQLQNDLFVAEGANDSVQMRKLSARIQTLQDSYKSLSIWPLLEAGEFGAITEGGISQEDLAISKGGYAALIDKIANKMPEGVRDVARYGFVTRDTSLFKALSRATQYGDFLGKAILYDDLRNRKKLSQTEALGYINEEFVNYNRFAGRNRAYLESMGMTWFYNFKLRSMKVGQRMLQKHPVRALLHTALTPRLPFLGSVGNPILDNMLGVIMDGRLGYSTGPGMLFRAPQLNPWWNLTN